MIHQEMTKVVVNYCLQIYSCFSGSACGGLFLGIGTVDIHLASNQVRKKPLAPQGTVT